MPTTHELSIPGSGQGCRYHGEHTQTRLVGATDNSGVSSMMGSVLRLGVGKVIWGSIVWHLMEPWRGGSGEGITEDFQEEVMLKGIPNLNCQIT